MTVFELIQRLAQFDPNKRVFFDDDEYGPSEIDDVSESSILVGGRMEKAIPKDAVFVS